MKRFEVVVGIGEGERVWEVNEDRLENFLFKLESLCIPCEVEEITEYIDRRGKWYIAFKNTDTIYLDSECEMWKTLYLNSEDKRPVAYYGEIF